MAAARSLPNSRQWLFLRYPFPWPQTDQAGHCRASCAPENKNKGKRQSHPKERKKKFPPSLSCSHSSLTGLDLLLHLRTMCRRFVVHILHLLLLPVRLGVLRCVVCGPGPSGPATPRWGGRPPSSRGLPFVPLSGTLVCDGEVCTTAVGTFGVNVRARSPVFSMASLNRAPMPTVMRPPALI